MADQEFSEGNEHSKSGNYRFDQVGQEIKEVKIEPVLSPEMLRLFNVPAETF